MWILSINNLLRLFINMAGGLLQIVSAGKENIFLTINPQITFFKTVYLRYSNFAIETQEEPFDGYANFGEEVVCNLSKSGDLIYNVYVKIELPQVLITKLNPTPSTTSINRTLLANLDRFSKPLFNLWRKLYGVITSLASNYNTINDTINAFQLSDDYQSYKLFQNVFSNNSIKLDLLERYSTLFKDDYVNSIYDPTQTLTFKQRFLSFLTEFKETVISYKRQLVDTIKDQEKIDAIRYNNFYRFGWVEKIGLRLIDKIQFELGGQVIDTITSDMLNIWQELTVNQNHRHIYDQMIGNVPELTNYSSTTHPSYTMYVPIPFWFSRYHGAAFPCVALRYHDVQISVKFRDINDCCFFEPYELSLPDDINIAQEVKLVNASLLVDYVFLDADEKTKYGSSNLEYLIEQHQMLQFYDINIKNFNCSLTFTNPVKELFWVVQQDNNIKRYKTWSKCYDVNIGKIYGFTNDPSTNTVKVAVQQYDIQQSDKVTITKTRFYDGTYPVVALDKDGNGMTTAVYIRVQYVETDTGYLEVKRLNNHNVANMILICNGVERTPRADSVFFNQLEAYKRHSTSPTDSGIYMYSFALHPEMFQPTGSCNMSLLTSNDIYFTLTDKLVDRLKRTNDTLTVKAFAKSMNILTIHNGISSLEFSV